MNREFPFEFESRFRVPLAAVGVTPHTARVVVTDDQFVAHFGFWTCATALANVRETCVTGPYHWFRAIGARGSMVDRGATFGTTTRGGVCILFHEPVSALAPFALLHHPGLTVTVADREGLVAALAAFVT